MKLKDILSKEEIEEYHKEWVLFKQKYASKHATPESEYNVHSGIPVISKVFKYKDKSLFRAHVFQKRLRKFDPYHIADKCIIPFWHAQHYLMVAEQMYTASSKLIIGDEYCKMMAKDVPIEFRWRKPLFWGENVSVELIREVLRKHNRYEKQVGYFTLYSDKTGKVLSRMSAASYWQPRAYVSCVERIKQGDKKALEALIRKIERQDISQKRLIQPRKNLPTKDYLINELKKGNILEEELHNFFSFWDKSK